MARSGGEATAQAEGAAGGGDGWRRAALLVPRVGGRRRRKKGKEGEKEKRKGKKEKGKGKKKNGEREKERESYRRDSRRRSTHAYGGFSRKQLACGTRKRGTQGRGLNSGVGSADHRKKISENQELGQERIWNDLNSATKKILKTIFGE